MEDQRQLVSEEVVNQAKAIVIEILETGRPIAEVAKKHKVKPAEVKEAISELAVLACPELINYGDALYETMPFEDKFRRMMQNASYVANQIRTMPIERLIDRISPLM